MHARRPEFIPEPDVMPDPGTLPDAAVPKRDDASEPSDGATVAPARRDPRWPVAALLGALAVNGLWVALLLWLLGRWIGVV
ncbi:MAG TPA: hypothetical protein VF744_02255 [Beijerinckiaceae bacterium]|jgi:hypothetical protein